MQTETPRVYVACLASYNNGRLHGRWIDVDDVDSMRAEIADMLRESPFPNVQVDCPECDGHGWTAGEGTTFPECDNCGGRGTVPSAEEWAVHDYDGFPSTFGEYPSLDWLVAYADALDEHGDAFAAYWRHSSHADPTVAAEEFADKYQGEHNTEEDWAEEFLTDTGALDEIPENLRHYFDFRAYARDARLGGDVDFVHHEGSLYVFWS